MFSRYSLAKKFSIRWSIYYIWRYVRYVKINDKYDYHSIDILFESMFLEERNNLFPHFLIIKLRYAIWSRGIEVSFEIEELMISAIVLEQTFPKGGEGREREKSRYGLTWYGVH